MFGASQPSIKFLINNFLPANLLVSFFISWATYWLIFFLVGGVVNFFSRFCLSLPRFINDAALRQLPEVVNFKIERKMFLLAS